MSNKPSIVQQLFDAIGIKRVVYVDDRFGITRERISIVCRDLTSEQITASGVFSGIILTDDETIREQRLTLAIDGLEDTDLQRIFDTLQELRGNGNAVQDRKAATEFSKTIGTAADVKLLSLAEWRAQSKTLIAEVGDKPTLFVFDDDFRLEGAGEEEGRRLINAIHGQLPIYKYAYALLTHKATDDSSEKELEIEIANKYPEITNFVMVIAKTRLTTDKNERFVHRIKTTLLFRLFRIMKTKLTETALAAHKDSLEKIESLSVDAFERIVYRSSDVEGAWSPETLVRIFGAAQERSVRSRLREDQELHKAVLEIDPLCGLETGVSAEVQEIAEELQRGEVYDSGIDLNRLHLPLECGDIFKTETGKQFILVGQPCDLVVRKSGRRKCDIRDDQQVVALVCMNSHIKSNKGKHPRDYEFELYHYPDDASKVWFASMNLALHIPIWVLDLAVLNAEGHCSIVSEPQTPDLLTLPWRKRLDILKERAKKVVNLVDQAAISAGENRDELLKSLLRLPLATPFSVKLEPITRKLGDPWQLNIGLQRISHLRDRYSDSLLSNYASYISRLDLPHDLTRFN
jgi:hypothetical protein